MAKNQRNNDQSDDDENQSKNCEVDNMDDDKSVFKSNNDDKHDYDAGDKDVDFNIFRRGKKMILMLTLKMNQMMKQLILLQQRQQEDSKKEGAQESDNIKVIQKVKTYRHPRLIVIDYRTITE